MTTLDTAIIPVDFRKRPIPEPTAEEEPLYLFPLWWILNQTCDPTTRQPLFEGVETKLLESWLYHNGRDLLQEWPEETMERFKRSLVMLSRCYTFQLVDYVLAELGRLHHSDWLDRPLTDFTLQVTLLYWDTPERLYPRLTFLRAAFVAMYTMKPM